MEVSSEAMLHHRVDSILFDAIGYTNITEDHLNVHETIENYRKCKFRLSSLLKDGAVVFSNGDDESCQLLTVNCKINFGVNSCNDCVISDIKECKDSVLFTVIYHHNTYLFSSHLSNISPNVSSTTDSLVENPSFKAFVESPIKRSTPSSPKQAILYKSAIGPIGVRSNL